MHIAFVCPHYPPGKSVNGVSTYTAFIARAIARQGHRVSVFSTAAPPGGRPAKPVRDEGIEVYSVGRRTFRVPGLRFPYYWIGTRCFPRYFQCRDGGVVLREAVRMAHEAHPIDVLECPEARALSHWVRSLGMPVVVRLHAPASVNAIANGAPKDARWRWCARAERACLRDAPFLTAPSRSIVLETERILGIKLPSVCVIPNPVPALTFAEPDSAQREAREILFVGRLDLHKGFDGLIQGFMQLASKPQFSDVRLRVVGPDHGLFLNGRDRLSGIEYVRRTIKDEGIHTRIDLMGPLPHEELHSVRARATVTIIPSRYEAFGLVVLEAMASGSALVASDAGAIPDIIQDGRNGLLFRSEDWNDLARQMERLLLDIGLRRRLATQAIEDVRKRYAPEIVAQSTLEYYLSVIECPGNQGFGVGHANMNPPLETLGT